MFLKRVLYHLKMPKELDKLSLNNLLVIKFKKIPKNSNIYLKQVKNMYQWLITNMN